MHKAGFVNIIGNPNVGKSTLMNALVGERLSIITSKAQTTRHRILGVVSGEDFQIVFSDTPGILKPSYKLQESMMKFVTGAVNDADVILYVTDTVEQSDRSNDILEKTGASSATISRVNRSLQYGNGGYEIGKQYAALKEPPKMIFCDSDAIALGALRAFHEEGISVPGDAELLSIGMLDPEAASYYVPSLSVVEMPNKEIGQQVLRLMRKKVLNNDMSSEHVKVHAKLMLRESFS
jgi:small GTP-binding protein